VQQPVHSPFILCVLEGGWALWQAMQRTASSRPDICTDRIKRNSEAHRLKVWPGGHSMFHVHAWRAQVHVLSCTHRVLT